MSSTTRRIRARPISSSSTAAECGRGHPRLHRLIEHPIATVVVLALAARVVVAVAAYLLTDRYTIPDEALYMALGRAVVHGVPPDQWYPGYGQWLYDQVGAFSRPLVLLFRVFGPERLVGAFFSAVVGAAVAGVTVAIGLRFLRPAFALLAGVVVALTPSQVLLSSVVLREAHIWLALALVGVGALHMARPAWRPLAVGVAVAAGGLLALGFLRDQTMLAAAWALALALLISPRRLWIPRMAAGLAVVLVVPLIGGAGLGGAGLVAHNADTLAQTRAKLGVGANSAFGGATPPPRAGATAGGPSPSNRAVSDAASQEDGVRSDLAHLPAGVVNVTLRPFPWESSPSLSLALARIETLEWYALCGLGVVVSVRRRLARRAMQYPIVLLGLLVGLAAVTQGNLGTAFRHRGQLLWVLALGAAAGAQWLWSRRAERRLVVTPAPVVTREEFPVLSAADNSLSADGR
jgi:hypothetical protein